MKKIKEFILDVLYEGIYNFYITPLDFLFRLFQRKQKRIFTSKDVPTLANINKKESYTLYIGRASEKRNLSQSKWCNRFGINQHRSRAEALLLDEEDKRNSKYLMNSLHELAGHTLGCYCFSSKTMRGKLCHGHTLIKLFKEKYNIQ